MPFSITHKLKMAQIVNEAISESEFSNFTVTHENFVQFNSSRGSFIKWVDENNPITRAFKQTALDRITHKNQFFHFKSLELAQCIISNKSIQVSNLLSNTANDFAEYSEFYKRMGLFHKFIPKEYCPQKNDIKHFSIANKSIMDEERDKILILCFTKDGHDKSFWKNYANNDKGVCLVFSLLDFKPDLANCYDFRDVSYDDGYRFDFINHINFHFKNEFGCQLFIEGLTKFSKFYKRGKYKWEKESRLVFDYNSNYYDILEKAFPIQTDYKTLRKYINLPLIGNFTPNPFFDLTIEEVICGKKVSQTEFIAIKNELTINFPKAIISQRK